MAEAAQSKKGKPRSAGKNKAKYIAYYTIRMPRKKLGHLLAHNQLVDAYDWAVKKQALGTLKTLAPKMDFGKMQERLNARELAKA